MSSRIRPARFVHVVYRTRRYDQMIDGYRTVFDAKVQHQDPADDWLAALRSGKAEADYLPRTVHQPVSPIRGNLFEA